MTTPRHDLKGHDFGRLHVLAFDHHDGKHAFWRCRCQCGQRKTISANSLRTGRTTSCGCFQKERAAEGQLKHGHNRRGKMSPEYRTWTGIITRCENPNDPGFRDYGDRGIKMTPEWRASFETFLRDVGPKPKGMTLERIDNDGDYKPGNVKWATRKEQARNRRSSAMVTWKGRELSIAALAEQEGVPYKRLWKRLRDGMPVESALCKTDLRQ